LEIKRGILGTLEVSAMTKKPDPKTLQQPFTEDHPGLLSDQFCDCHRLQICPTAWMNPDGANEGSPLVAEMRLDLEDLE